MAGPLDFSPLLRGGPVDFGQQFAQGQAIGTSALQARSVGIDQQGAVMQQQAFARDRQVMEEDRVIKLQALKLAQQQAVAGAQRELAYRAEMDVASKARDSGALTELMLRHPEKAKDIKVGYDALVDTQKRETVEMNSMVRNAMMSGADDVAVDVVQERADAIRETNPGAAAKLDAMAKRIKANPDGEFARVVGVLAAIDPEKQAATSLLLNKEQSDVAAAGSDADKRASEAVIKGVEAGVAPEMAQADLGERRARTARLFAQTKNEALRLALDERKLASDVALAREKIQVDKYDLPPASAKARDDAVLASSSAQVAAESTREIAGKFRKLGQQNVAVQFLETGINGQAGNYISAKLGMKDDVAALRTRFRGVVNNDVLKSLPPGAASDKDVEMVRAGFEGEFGDYNQLADSLDAMERIQRRIAVVKEAEAEWQQQNRGLGSARADVVINGRLFPQGTSFKKATADIVGALDKGIVEQNASDLGGVVVP